jgi:hypothetical protein
MQRPVKLVVVVAVTAATTVLLAPAAAPVRHEIRMSGPPQAGARPFPDVRVRPEGAKPLETLAPRPVSVLVDGFYSWALLDRVTGRIAGSENIAATTSTESMIKVWIVSDHLRRHAEKRVRPGNAAFRLGRSAIRDSDDNATQVLYQAGDQGAGIRRMISICGLTDTTIHPGRWSRTQISARDAVRMGGCVADGRAAGAWTSWVLREMTLVRGSTAAKDQRARSGGGRWGIIDGLPAEVVERGVGIKNGWTAVGSTGKWHVNCLAIAEAWVLAVLMRYPIANSLRYGANVCKKVTTQLVAAPSDPAAVG